MLVAAQARTDCIEEQTGAEPILPADIELVAMEADTDNSNCPPGNFESLAEYCAPNVREQLEVPPFDLVAHDEPNVLGRLDLQRAAFADCQVFQTQPTHSSNHNLPPWWRLLNRLHNLLPWWCLLNRLLLDWVNSRLRW